MLEVAAVEPSVVNVGGEWDHHVLRRQGSSLQTDALEEEHRCAHRGLDVGPRIVDRPQARAGERGRAEPDRARVAGENEARLHQPWLADGQAVLVQQILAETRNDEGRIVLAPYSAGCRTDHRVVAQIGASGVGSNKDVEDVEHVVVLDHLPGDRSIDRS